MSTTLDSGPPSSSAPSARPGRKVRVGIQIIAVLLSIAALKYGASVILPLAFSLFTVALFWPVQSRLQRILPRGVAACITLALLLLTIGALAGGIGWTTDRMLSESEQYADRSQQIIDQVSAWLGQVGLSWPGPEEIDVQALLEQAQRVVAPAVSFVSGLVLVIAFFFLSLLEVDDFAAKLDYESRHADEHKRSARRVARDFQHYIMVRTLIGLITGAGVALGAWVIGLDFPILWGLLNFLLNYIPTLGSILGVIPPMLFAILQFGELSMVLLTGGVVGGVQLLSGVVIDPWLQGRFLQLSALVVLISVVFWGWVWGIAGAFIAVPMTILIALIAREYDSSHWIATVLAEWQPDEGVPATDRGR